MFVNKNRPLLRAASQNSIPKHNLTIGEGEVKSLATFPQGAGSDAVLKVRKLADRSGACLTIYDVAGVLRIGVSTARRLLAQGKLPPPDIRLSQRLLRWNPSTIAAFVEGRAA